MRDIGEQLDELNQLRILCQNLIIHHDAGRSVEDEIRAIRSIVLPESDVVLPKMVRR